MTVPWGQPYVGPPASWVASASSRLLVCRTDSGPGSRGCGAAGIWWRDRLWRGLDARQACRSALPSTPRVRSHVQMKTQVHRRCPCRAQDTEAPGADGLCIPHPFRGREAPRAARLLAPGLGGDRSSPGGQRLLGAGDGGFTEKMRPCGPRYMGMGNPWGRVPVLGREWGALLAPKVLGEAGSRGQLPDGHFPGT